LPNENYELLKAAGLIHEEGIAPRHLDELNEALNSLTRHEVNQIIAIAADVTHVNAELRVTPVSNPIGIPPPSDQGRVKPGAKKSKR
jgi:hypothetical protein